MYSLFSKIFCLFCRETAFVRTKQTSYYTCMNDATKIHCYSQFKEYMSDSFNNYNYVGNTKVSVSIKKTYANKCTLSEIFLTEILKSFSVF